MYVLKCIDVIGPSTLCNNTGTSGLSIWASLISETQLVYRKVILSAIGKHPWLDNLIFLSDNIFRGSVRRSLFLYYGDFTSAWKRVKFAIRAPVRYSRSPKYVFLRKAVSTEENGMCVQRAKLCGQHKTSETFFCA